MCVCVCAMVPAGPVQGQQAGMHCGWNRKFLADEKGILTS